MRRTWTSAAMLMAAAALAATPASSPAAEPKRRKLTKAEKKAAKRARHAPDYAAMEREHLGDPEKGTGIYAASALPVSAQAGADQRKPWEKTSWTCALARVNHEGMHCPERKCADCPNRTAGVEGQPPTKQQDQWLHDAVKRSSTLVAPGKLADADGVNGVDAASPLSGAWDSPYARIIASIDKPYTLCELREKIDSGEYGAELMLQHAMRLLGAGETREGSKP